MKKTLITLLSAVLFLVAPMAAQTILTNTTLASAVSNSSVRGFNLTSVTGVSAPSGSDYTKQTFLYVDRELVDVQSVSGTVVQVVRGVGGTFAASHASGAVVFVMPAYLTTYFGSIPQGSCTRGNELALPRIYAASGIISDCLGGQWIQGDAMQSTRTLNSGYRFPDPGATALTALETAGTAPSAATEQYCTEIDLPFSMLVTGLAALNGTTVGTDKHIVALYDASGNLLANSATAGATTANASTYQKINFTSKYYAVGPARYFGCVQTNGTTDTLRHAITAVNDNILGGAVTTQVFGTVKNVTLPSTFTTAKAPYYLVF